MGIPNGDILVGITVDFESTTGEAMDCITFTLPPGYTYVQGSETNIGDGLGNYISDTGNSVTYGTAGACPGGGSGASVFGNPPYRFAFEVIPNAGFDPGSCTSFDDGDGIIGVTWDYTGDGVGEASASTPGNNGDPTTSFDIFDIRACPANGVSVGVIETGSVVSCQADINTITFVEEPVFECGQTYTFAFIPMGGTGGIINGFTMFEEVTLPFSFDAILVRPHYWGHGVYPVVYYKGVLYVHIPTKNFV